jgi:hypothetical protein
MLETLSELIHIPVETLKSGLTTTIIGTFCLLFMLGASNRVVIFADTDDLANTAGIFGWPILGAWMLMQCAPEEPPADYSMMWGSWYAGLVSVFFITLFVVSVCANYALAIAHNNVKVGLVIGTFKVLAAGLILLCSLGLIGKLWSDDEDRHAGYWAMMLLAIAFLAYALKVMVNGQAVAERRARLQAQAH